MNISKLNIDKYKKSYLFDNINKYDFSMFNSSLDSYNLVFNYIDRKSDLSDCIHFIKGLNIEEDNRVIFVYEKGKDKEVNRDVIIDYIKNKCEVELKQRKPMLCSLSDELSAFVFSLEK